MLTGIDSLSIYTSRYYVALAALAGHRGIAPQRIVDKLGQEKMAAPPPGEDIVTLAANAGRQALAGRDLSRIQAVLLATESAIDQSKAAGIYVHRLLGLPARCRVVELKQACYGATAALMMANAMVRQNPSAEIMVLAADVARYGLGAAGEPTQGAGAAAMVVSASPRLLALDPESGYYTRDVMDFWRPNYRHEALVDGKASIRIYLQALSESWLHYREQSGRGFTDFGRFCYHLPFTRMGEMAHHHLCREFECHMSMAELEAQIADSLIYNRIIGNTYAGSLYVGLASLLDHADEDLAGQRLGLFSYGSGCVGEFYSGTIQPGYRQHLHTAAHRALLDSRLSLSVEEYERFYSYRLPEDGSALELPPAATGHYRLARLCGHQRNYEAVEPLEPSRPLPV